MSFSFTTVAALPPNMGLTNITGLLTSYSFSACGIVCTDLISCSGGNNVAISVATNANGHIEEWSAQLTYGMTQDIQAMWNATGDATFSSETINLFLMNVAGYFGDPGIWTPPGPPTPTPTPTATPTPTPEPSVILQLAAGGVGLAFLNKRRMRKNRRAKPTS